MPLKNGKSKKTINANIAELIDTYKESGKIGNTTPKNMKHAQKIAAAIAYSKAKKHKKKQFKKFLEAIGNNSTDIHTLEFVKNAFNICFENLEFRPILLDEAKSLAEKISSEIENHSLNNFYKSGIINTVDDQDDILNALETLQVTGSNNISNEDLESLIKFIDNLVPAFEEEEIEEPTENFRKFMESINETEDNKEILKFIKLGFETIYENMVTGDCSACGNPLDKKNSNFCEKCRNEGLEEDSKDSENEKDVKKN